MQSEGYTIYELKSCRTTEEVTAIGDYLKSRLRLGKLPLIVIDGLDANVRKWQELAYILDGLPVKFLVTAREEDWFRYALDSTKVGLRLLDIFLAIDEAP